MSTHLFIMTRFQTTYTKDYRHGQPHARPSQHRHALEAGGWDNYDSGVASGEDHNEGGSNRV